MTSLIILTGLPVTTQHSLPNLKRFLLRKLGEVNTGAHDKILAPLDQHGMSRGYAIIRYESTEEADAAIAQHDGAVLDRQHTMRVQHLQGSATYGQAQAAGEVDGGDVDALVSLELRT